jgi:hypothetical protein
MNVTNDCPLPLLWVDVNHSIKRSSISVSQLVCACMVIGRSRPVDFSLYAF